MTTARAPSGEKPTGVVAESVDLPATIEAIDRNRPTAILKGQYGKLVTIKGGNFFDGFDNLKVADSIDIGFTEAVAIFVEIP